MPAYSLRSFAGLSVQHRYFWFGKTPVMVAAHHNSGRSCRFRMHHLEAIRPIRRRETAAQVVNHGSTGDEPPTRLSDGTKAQQAPLGLSGSWHY